MTIYFRAGDEDTSLSDADLAQALTGVLGTLGPRHKVALVPPDFTRLHSRAGTLTRIAAEYYGDAIADILPALGTHVPMSGEQIALMYPGTPHHKFREHNWRDDVVTIGEVPAEFVSEATEGLWRRPWPVQLNGLLWSGGHDLVLSIGQVVPHEVIGMANYNKNLFIGTGGSDGINESHFIGAAYGMERMMGRADTPLRRILNAAQDRFCAHLPWLFALTVVGSDANGELHTRGLFIGDSHDCFEAAAELSARVNITPVPTPLEKVVVNLPGDEFRSTWLGNKAIYRTRMAIADAGELIVLGPGIEAFGEDKAIDDLIRRFGYCGTPAVMQHMENHAELHANLSAAAHLIHGSSEGRFDVTYCPGHLTREETESVGFNWADLASMQARYQPAGITTGYQVTSDGEPYYYIDNPALGLWVSADRLPLQGG